MTLNPDLVVEEAALEVAAEAPPEEPSGTIPWRGVAAFLRDDRAAWSLEDVAYTLSREIVPAACRLALVCEAAAELPAELDGLAERLERGESIHDRRGGVFFEEQSLFGHLGVHAIWAAATGCGVTLVVGWLASLPWPPRSD